MCVACFALCTPIIVCSFVLIISNPLPVASTTIINEASFLEDTLITCVLPFSFFGFIYHDPSGHYFYNWLDDMPYPSSLRLPPKAIDQLFWCPIYMSVLFTCFGLVYGDSFATIGSMIKNNLLSTRQSSWKVWPIVHLINFKFISIKWFIPCSFYLLEHC